MNRGAGSARPDGLPPRRWHFIVAAIGYLSLAVYGSLVPLTYQALDWNEALTRFAEIRYLNLGIESRSDWVANILLFVPLAWLTMGALCVDRSLIWVALCAIAVAVACHLLSWTIEFVQLYFPPRTVSVNDIVAETIGGAIGCVAWLVCGQAITNWSRQIWALNRARSALPMLLLPGYVLVLVLIHLMPMDLTISPAEVYHKFKAGRILPIPFSQVDRGWEFAQGTIWNMIYFAPFGWLLAALHKPDGSARFGLLAIGGVGLLATTAIEAMQLFVYTRSSDTTDIVTGTAAVIAAAAVVRCFSSAADFSRVRSSASDLGSTAGARTVEKVPRGQLRGARVLGWFLPVAWCGALAVQYWWPLRFTTAPLPEANGVPLPLWRARRMYWLPFKDYYWKSEFESFDQVLQKSISFAVLGILLAIGWRLRSTWLAVGLAVLVASVLELGQFFVVAPHFPSVTDVLVETLGAWCGFALWQRWQRPQVAVIAISK